MKKSIRIFLTYTWIVVTCKTSHALTLWDDHNHEIGTKGYVRAGAGISDGHTQVCFKAPGAGAKYRLGNECDVYGKAGVYYQYKENEEQNPFFVRYEYTPEFSGD